MSPVSGSETDGKINENVVPKSMVMLPNDPLHFGRCGFITSIEIKYTNLAPPSLISTLIVYLPISLFKLVDDIVKLRPVRDIIKEGGIVPTEWLEYIADDEICDTSIVLEEPPLQITIVVAVEG